MRGEFEAAFELAEPAEKYARELGVPATPEFAEIEALAGNLEAAAARYGLYCDFLAERGLTAPISTYAGWRGRLLCELGRYEDAERLAMQSRELVDADDPITQAYWRQVAALVHASRGEHRRGRTARPRGCRAHEADRFAQGPGRRTTRPRRRARSGRPTRRAADTFRDALECYDRKRILPLARQLRERLDTLQR